MATPPPWTESEFLAEAHQSELALYINYKPSDFEYVRTFAGPGSSGNMNGGVFLVRRKRDGLLCVKKVMQREGHYVDEPNYVLERGSAFPGSARVEAHIAARLRGFRNPHLNYIIAYLEFQHPPGSEPQRILYVKYSDMGSLGRLMAKYEQARQRVPEEFIWHVFLSMAKALSTLHFGTSEALNRPFRPEDRLFNHITHFDVKPDNIFLSEAPDQAYPLVVLGDFGCTTSKDMLNSQQKSVWGRMSIRTTRNIVPPEDDGEWSSRLHDVFALGLCIMRMMGVRPAAAPALRHQREIDRIDTTGYSRTLCDVVRKAVDLTYETRVQAAPLVAYINSGVADLLSRGRIKDFNTLGATGCPAIPESFFSDLTERQPNEFRETSAHPPASSTHGRRSHQDLPIRAAQGQVPQEHRGLGQGGIHAQARGMPPVASIRGGARIPTR